MQLVSALVLATIARNAMVVDPLDITFGTAWWWAYAGVSCFLVIFAGIMSGLTLGLMSLGLVELEILHRSGTLTEKKQAVFTVERERGGGMHWVSSLAVATAVGRNAMVVDPMNVAFGMARWWAVSCFLVIFAGIMPGLTLGFMSLEILHRSGTATEKKQAS